MLARRPTLIIILDIEWLVIAFRYFCEIGMHPGDPLPLIELKTQTLAEFEEGVALYHQEKLAQAQEIFLSVLQINDQDKAARFYVERCEPLQTYGIYQGWEAIETLHEKL